MANLRPKPQAKYKLLLENARPPINAKRSLMIVILILTVISGTGFTAYIAWTTFSSVQEMDYRLRMAELSKNRTVSTSKWQQRTHLYGMALKNNMNTSTWVLPNVSAQSRGESEGSQSVLGTKLVCYYVIPVAKNDLQPQKLDPSLCTHIIVAFAHVDNSTITHSPGDEEIYRQVVALKTVNPSLKVLLSVGGGSSYNLKGFALMVASRSTRNKFVISLLSLLAEFKLDGIDFDWEFPAWQSDSLQRFRFTQLLKELRAEIDKKKLSLLVTIAVAAPQPIVDQAYDVPEMAKFVDFVNLMTYDFHFYVWYSPMTGLNAPLYAQESEKGYMRTLNTNFSAWYWVSKGMPAHKIIIGLPTYGHSFTLVNKNNHGLSAPASGNGVLGAQGFTSYMDACWFITEGQATSVFDSETKVPYAFKGREWISYDDERSLAYKAEFVTNNHFGGAMILSLNMDDHSGQCSGGKVNFPLTRQVANTLQDDQL